MDTGSERGDGGIMRCKEIIEILQQEWPQELACAWDNVGLLVGDGEAEVKKILLALDATDDIIEQAVENGADLLITHHPLLFQGMKQVTTEGYIGRRVVKLIQNGISCYAMHTNFDVRTMAVEAAKRLNLSNCRVLERTGEWNGAAVGIGQVGYLPQIMTLQQCAESVKEAFHLKHIQAFGDLQARVCKAAISPGSGKREMIPALESGAELLITGDIGHHDGLDATAQGLLVLDAGHYGLEHIFSAHMEKFLNKELEGIIVIKGRENAPFEVI